MDPSTSPSGCLQVFYAVLAERGQKSTRAAEQELFADPTFDSPPVPFARQAGGSGKVLRKGMGVEGSRTVPVLDFDYEAVESDRPEQERWLVTTLESLNFTEEPLTINDGRTFSAERLSEIKRKVLRLIISPASLGNPKPRQPGDRRPTDPPGVPQRRRNQPPPIGPHFARRPAQMSGAQGNSRRQDASPGFDRLNRPSPGLNSGARPRGRFGAPLRQMPPRSKTKRRLSTRPPVPKGRQTKKRMEAAKSKAKDNRSLVPPFPPERVRKLLLNLKSCLGRAEGQPLSFED